MSAEQTDAVDSRHPELTVCGYVRGNYRHSIPVAIVNLMESFYSLWIKKRVSGEQLQRLKEMGSRGYTEIPFHNLLMNGFRMEMVLRASRNNLFHDNKVFLWLAINASPEMDFIAGNFAVSFDGERSARSHWERSTGNRICINDAKFRSESDIQNGDDMSIRAYIDITQIKWKEDEKEDFDITPTLKGYGQHHWLIDDDVITKLDCNADTTAGAECHSQNGWKIAIGRYWGAPELKIGISPPFKPINVDTVFVEMTVQWDIDGKRHCFEGVGRCGIQFDVGLTFYDIHSITELIFEWKIFRVKGLNGQDIPLSDWLSNGIDVGANQ